MKISNLPRAPLLDEHGNLNPEWHDTFALLVNQMQIHLNDERYILPNQPTDTINELNDQKSEGGIVYDNTAKSGKINTNGTFKTLSTYDNLSTNEINAIPSGQRDGKFVRDTTTGDLKVGINNEFKTVTLT